MKKTILLVVLVLVLVVSSYNVSAWDTNPTYNPFEVVWNAIDNVSTSWTDGTGKVTTDVSVGIGTTNPSSKLDVNGTVKATSFTGALQWSDLQNVPSGLADGDDVLTESEVDAMVADNGYLLDTGDTATGDYDFDSGTLYVDSVNDRLGIGTTSPSYELDVSGDARTTGDIYLDGQDIVFSGASGGLTASDSYIRRVSAFGRIEIKPNDASYGVYIKQTSGSAYGNLEVQESYFTLGHNVGDGPLYITSDNVGIGTPSPSEKLDVDGDIKVRGSDVYDDSGNLRLSGEDSVSINIDYNNNDADTRAIIFGKNSMSSPIELMRITESGNVGIGTTNPLSKLSAGGDGVSGAGVYGLGSGGSDRYGGYFSAGGSPNNNYGIYSEATGVLGNRYGIYSLGRIGIVGTRDPSHTVQTSGAGVYGAYDEDNYGYLGGFGGSRGVYGRGSVHGGYFENTDTGGIADYGVGGSATGSGGTRHYGGYFEASGASTNYGVYGEGTEYGGYFVGDGYFSGNVGIGTESPTVSTSNGVEVLGNNPAVRITSDLGYWPEYSFELISNYIDPDGAGGADPVYRFEIKDVNADEERLVITDDGNVGIGTTNTTAKLDVSGSGRFTDVLSTEGGLKLENAGSAPVSCDSTNAGYVYFDTGSNTFKGCNSTSWVTLA